MQASGLGKAAYSKIAILFLVPGVLSLLFSILYESQVAAFVGLGLTFWGALFFLIRPVKYVTGNLLHSSAHSSYSTIDRIIKDFGYKGTAYYIPPYPKDVYLPDHLKGLKEPVVFVSEQKQASMPSIEEIAESKFRISDPKGLLMTSPGAGLLAQIEKEANRDFAKTTIADLQEMLPHVISENLSLAREVELKLVANQIQLRLIDSLYKSLYSRESDLKSIGLLGCPLVSAVACAIAKASGKPVMIQNQKVSPDGSMIGVWYRVVQE